jgi:hypothetical protein
MALSRDRKRSDRPVTSSPGTRPYAARKRDGRELGLLIDHYLVLLL